MDLTPPTDKESVPTSATMDHNYFNNYRRAYDGFFWTSMGAHRFLSISGPDTKHPPSFYENILNSLRGNLPKKNGSTNVLNAGQTYQLKVTRIKTENYLVSFRPTNWLRHPNNFDGVINLKRNGSYSMYNADSNIEPSDLVKYQVLGMSDITEEEGLKNAERGYYEFRLMNSLHFPGWSERVIALDHMKGPGKWYLVSLRHTQDDLILGLNEFRNPIELLGLDVEED